MPENDFIIFPDVLRVDMCLIVGAVREPPFYQPSIGAGPCACPGLATGDQ